MPVTSPGLLCLGCELLRTSTLAISKTRDACHEVIFFVFVFVGETAHEVTKVSFLAIFGPINYPRHPRPPSIPQCDEAKRGQSRRDDKTNNEAACDDARHWGVGRGRNADEAQIPTYYYSLWSGSEDGFINGRICHHR
ncbi:hypothetical protein LY76DRAFT_67351 [Colletotrichum caudatum]|nr:hypothetical protein LY76DRAFT_67351 [Colletotrichum caudatum]